MLLRLPEEQYELMFVQQRDKTLSMWRQGERGCVLFITDRPHTWQSRVSSTTAKPHIQLILKTVRMQHN